MYNLKETEELNEINNEEEYDDEFTGFIKDNDKYSKNKTLKVLKSSYKILFFIMVIILIVIIYQNSKVEKEIEYINNLQNIPRPIQTPASGKAFKSINGTNLEISFVASYKIYGRVVDVQNYYGNSTINKLSPKDVGISWGALALEQNNKKIKWNSAGNRFLSWRSSDGEFISKMGGENKIGEYFSNNHLIPSDDNIEKTMSAIEQGDYIMIEGYLVNVFGKNFTWNTSTTRTDSGDGACEIIYVTSIKWLQER